MTVCDLCNTVYDLQTGNHLMNDCSVFKNKGAGVGRWPNNKKRRIISKQHWNDDPVWDRLIEYVSFLPPWVVIFILTKQMKNLLLVVRSWVWEIVAPRQSCWGSAPFVGVNGGCVKLAWSTSSSTGKCGVCRSEVILAGESYIVIWFTLLWGI